MKKYRIYSEIKRLLERYKLILSGEEYEKLIKELSSILKIWNEIVFKIGLWPVGAGHRIYLRFGLPA